MLNKKSCKKCKEKLSGKFNFCPNCGTPLYRKEEWGMLGKNDFDDSKEVFEGMGGGMLGRMLNSTLKMLEKEMKKEGGRIQPQPNSNFKLMINGKEVKLNNQQSPKPKKEPKKKTLRFFDEEKLSKFSSLPREEAKTNLKRLGNKILYEIYMPGLKSIEDVQIVALESSIEIKAISDKKAYYKFIPFNMEIVSQNIEKGKLILEFQEN